ncbi:MAG TPA: hypothetical protein VFI31_16135 [Pirellulales bacterium]|nr:hypothetical protein [Pirellulales bacterium]
MKKDLLGCGLACILSAACFAGYWQTYIPAQGSLTTVHGKPLETPSHLLGGDVLFRIEGHDADLKYIDWCPQAREVLLAVENGDELTVSFAVDGDPRSVWSVATDTKQLVSYGEVARARRRNAMVACALAVLFGILFIYYAARLLLLCGRSAGQRQRRQQPKMSNRATKENRLRAQ